MNASTIFADRHTARARTEESLVNGNSTTEPQISEPLDWRLFAIVTTILAILVTLFVLGAMIQWQGYNEGIKAALSESVKDHAAILSYNRALGAAIVKTSAVFLGYLLVFTGALYVLRITSTTYRLGVGTEHYKGTLQTSSPGLVIITLGIFLIAITILTRSDINYQGSTKAVPAPLGDSNGRDWQPIESKPTLGGTAPPSERK